MSWQKSHWCSLFCQCQYHALFAIHTIGIFTEGNLFFGTDGASANIAANGLKGLVEQELNWVFWMWCLVH